MNARKSIFYYLAQVFGTFGTTVAALIVICAVFGDSAQEVSKMFALGGSGLSLALLTQFLGVSFLMVALRIFFTSDYLVKKIPLVARNILMLLAMLLLLTTFIVIFQWFPLDMWEPWAMFLLSFTVSLAISTAYTALRSKWENRQMEEGLNRLKQQWEEL